MRTVPLYLPELLGNAYGGGFIITPSVFAVVSPQATGPAKGVPPGYGFSLAPGEPGSIGRSTILASDKTFAISGYTPGVSSTPAKDKTGQPVATVVGTNGVTAQPVGTVVITDEFTGRPVGTAVASNVIPIESPDPPANSSFIIPTPSFIPFQGFATRLSVGGAATLLLGLLGIMLYL